MARFIMTNRRAGKFLDAQKTASREAVESRFHTALEDNASDISTPPPTDELARRVFFFDADPEEVAAKAADFPEDVIVEPEIPHRPVQRWAPPPVGVQATAVQTAAVMDAIPTAAAAPLVSVRVVGSGAPLHGAGVILTVRDLAGEERGFHAETDADGEASLWFPLGLIPTSLVVVPAGGHWSVVLRAPFGANVQINCPPLPPGQAIDWWHDALGIAVFDPNRGAGIKIGVIDTGFGPNGCLPHVIDAGAFLGAVHLPGLGGDVESHGTHVCGTIGARPVNPATQRSGIAPGATLFSARVFPGADTIANQGDLVLAIDALSRIRRVDLINISLSARQPSEIEHDAIVDALQRGTLCICAAGNTGGGLEWPARFPETVAVTALGFKDAPAPKGTLSFNRMPMNPAMHGNGGLFLANFSSFGSDADVTGPGVGIIATVPERFGLRQPYASMDGTSMASPVVCGALAALLAVSPTYKALAGVGYARAEEARAILRHHCKTVGLAAVFQGNGIPRVP
jgi:subtilisin family serine protease